MKQPSGKQTVSRFLKRIFRRDLAPVESKQRTCHSCNCPLQSQDMGRRTLERCPKCLGIWLTRTELEALLTQVSEDTDAGLAVSDSDGEASIGHTFAPSRLSRACPECQEAMENYRFDETGIWIDGCNAGHGIWLDQGELRLIISRQTNRESDEGPDDIVDAVSDLILGSL